jgi:hypothetical protein
MKAAYYKTGIGLSTAVGFLVMNSVVVLEHIFRHKEMGHDKRTAAAREQTIDKDYWINRGLTITALKAEKLRSKAPF